MSNLINEVLSKTFKDYKSNQASEKEIEDFKNKIFDLYFIILDAEYLNFLSCLNGFELNGLNFYGTVENMEKYILSGIKQNEFWKMELESLSMLYILGDGDMDFYCYSDITKKYTVLDKGGLREIKAFSQFEELVNYLIATYIN
jgi:hypothetical protein